MKENNKSELNDFVVMLIGHQYFGILVKYITDILLPQKINSIPLARKEIIGSINLRGRIVTALDMRKLLGINDPFDPAKTRCVVLSHNNELFCLIVDKVQEVIPFSFNTLINNPDNFNELWHRISLGILPMKEELVVVLDIDEIMKLLME